MRNALIYLFWPNPGNATYSSPKVLALMIICALFVLASVGIGYWRRKSASPSMRKVSKSWSSATLWFGLSGLILAVSRVEQIQYVSMRFVWVLWLAALVFYVYWQMRNYRLRHYEIIPQTKSIDPRSAYLPKRKKR